MRYQSVAITAVKTVVAVCVPDCAGPQSGGKWRSEHQKVLIKGEKPILYNKSALECANGGFLIASESKPKAQAVSDDMKWQAQAELGLQVLSNAFIGMMTGYNAIDKPKPGEIGDPDYDILSPFLEVISYVNTDINRATSGNTPMESAEIGAYYTAGSFGVGLVRKLPIPAMQHPWVKALSSEFNAKDIILAVITTAARYFSDEGKAKFNDSAVRVITGIEDSKTDFSGKSVIATEP